MINVAAPCVFNNHRFIDFDIAFIFFDVINLADTVAHMNCAVVHVVGFALLDTLVVDAVNGIVGILGGTGAARDIIKIISKEFFFLRLPLSLLLKKIGQTASFRLTTCHLKFYRTFKPD